MKVNPKGREGGWMDGKEGKKNREAGALILTTH